MRNARISRRTAVKVIYWNTAAAIIMVCMAAASITRRLHKYDALIVRVAKEQGVDPRLVSSVIWKESRFNPAAVGKAGEIGLMQVTKAAGEDWSTSEKVEIFSRDDLFDPEINIRVGSWYLGRAIREWSKYDDPLPYALAEYNAGRSRAKEWEEKGGSRSRDFWQAIGISSTKQYVKDILERYRGKV